MKSLLAITKISFDSADNITDTTIIEVGDIVYDRYANCYIVESVRCNNSSKKCIASDDDVYKLYRIEDSLVHPEFGSQCKPECDPDIKCYIRKYIYKILKYGGNADIINF